MPTPNAKPVRFVPTGLSDADDSSLVFPGSCTSLQNLIFDQANPGYVVTRPGVGDPIVAQADFDTWAGETCGFISAHIGLGTRIYGMVGLTSGTNTGLDVPFCYDTATGAFVAISGTQDDTTLPTSPSDTGAWTPPTMAVVGVQIVITHPGYDGSGVLWFGAIDIGTPATPAYTAQNTATYGLPSVPTSVVNFNNRAYFACDNEAFYSDVLDPLTMTNSGQALTLGDTTPITGFAGLPVTTSTAGVVSTLLVFKATQIWMITGDAALTGTLAQNYLSLSQGTSSPRSIVQSPRGTQFIGTDGAMQIDQLGVLRALASPQSTVSDVRIPFSNAREPSRIAAGFSSNIYRVSLDTVINSEDVTNDYWFDFRWQRWNGPHTFTYDCVSVIGTNFILSEASLGAQLFENDPIPELTTLYEDNGVGIIGSLTSSAFPNTNQMQEVQVVESTIELASGGFNLPFLVTALNDQLDIMDAVTILLPFGSGSYWGTGIWGVMVWLGSTVNTRARVYTVPWTLPLVFQKMIINVTCQGQSVIGPFFARYKLAGYTNDK